MIKTVRIVDVIRAAENSKYGAQLVKVTHPNTKYEITAYAKELTPLDFLVELMTTLLARDLGIPMPEPVIVFSKDGKKVLFGTIDVKYPDLSHRLAIQNDMVLSTDENIATLKGLSEWGKMHDAIAFDEWIANQDRHVGNILYDGGKEYMLIDNNLAMRPHFSPLNPIANNQLLGLHLKFNVDEVSKQRVKSKISNLIDYFDNSLPQNISAKLKFQFNGISHNMLDQMVSFLDERLTKLSELTTNKIPVQQRSIL